jgi:hypothetical protein
MLQLKVVMSAEADNESHESEEATLTMWELPRVEIDGDQLLQPNCGL